MFKITTDTCADNSNIDGVPRLLTCNMSDLFLQRVEPPPLRLHVGALPQQHPSPTTATANNNTPAGNNVNAGANQNIRNSAGEGEKPGGVSEPPRRTIFSPDYRFTDGCTLDTVRAAFAYILFKSRICTHIYFIRASFARIYYIHIRVAFARVYMQSSTLDSHSYMRTYSRLTIGCCTLDTVRAAFAFAYICAHWHP